MKSFLAASISLFFFVSHYSFAQRPAEVMLMGTFHFSNPGLDVVKTRKLDVLSDSNQAYLIAFVKRVVTSFAPTDVLMECSRDREEELNEEYQQYLKGNFELPVNETYQVGFRVAEQSGTKRVLCYDENEVHWNGEALFKELPKSAPELKLEFDRAIAELTERDNKMHQELGLGEILKHLNSQASEAENKALYILTNEVGANGEGYAGADATASWWHRNFRMYANIQKHAVPERRLFVIGGQGHTAILKDLLELDTKRIGRSVAPNL